VAFLGLGTVNVLSLAADLPRDPAGLARLIVGGHSVRVPVASVGGRRFLLFLEAGFGADAVVRANRWAEHAIGRWLLAGGLLRRPRKKLLIGLAGLVSALAAWGRPLRIEGVDELSGVRAADVLLTRVREYGGRLFLPTRVGLDEPAFELLAFTSRWPLTHLLAFFMLATGTVERHAGLLERLGLLRRARARTARITGTEGVSVFADAETLRAGSEVVCGFEPARSIRLVVPPGWKPHREPQMRSK
jgi:diacylglycerol kinase family enzyme